MLQDNKSEKNRDGELGMLPFDADMSTFTIKER